MNFKKLILFIILFVGLSYYYFHHELVDRAQDNIGRAIETKILHLADDQVLDFISIENALGDVILEKDEKGIWHITSPVQYPADSFKAQIYQLIALFAKH